jgi:N-acetylglutamate synthase-like GNAT family acetyltransferase
MMGHDDRALFLLREIPNNRIMPTGFLRLLEMNDMGREPIKSGLTSIDRNSSWNDMLYEMRVHPERRTFVYEVNGRLSGYISVQFAGQGVLFLDTVAVDENVEGRGVGSNLVRWAETFARHNDCHTIELWAIGNKVSWYENRDFKKTSDAPLSLVEGKLREDYYKMRKTVLFNRLGVLD